MSCYDLITEYVVFKDLHSENHILTDSFIYCCCLVVIDSIVFGTLPFPHLHSSSTDNPQYYVALVWFADIHIHSCISHELVVKLIYNSFRTEIGHLIRKFFSKACVNQWHTFNYYRPLITRWLVSPFASNNEISELSFAGSCRLKWHTYWWDNS